jgi:hypothetical protein
MIAHVVTMACVIAIGPSWNRTVDSSGSSCDGSPRLAQHQRLGAEDPGEGRQQGETAGQHGAIQSGTDEGEPPGRQGQTEKRTLAPDKQVGRVAQARK